MLESSTVHQGKACLLTENTPDKKWEPRPWQRSPWGQYPPSVPPRLPVHLQNRKARCPRGSLCASDGSRRSACWNKNKKSHLNSQDRNAVFSSINFSLSDCFFSLFVVLFFFFLFTVLPICERVEARHRNKRCRYDDVSKSIESTKTNSSLLHLKLILDRCEVKDGKSELKPAHWTPS